jgi:hypothetical protein
MRIKSVLAAVLVAGSTMSAQAGGLLDEQVTVPPTQPAPAPAAATGSLGGNAPLIIGGLVVLGAIAAGSGS